MSIEGKHKQHSAFGNDMQMRDAKVHSERETLAINKTRSFAIVFKKNSVVIYVVDETGCDVK